MIELILGWLIVRHAPGAALHKDGKPILLPLWRMNITEISNYFICFEIMSIEDEIVNEILVNPSRPDPRQRKKLT